MTVLDVEAISKQFGDFRAVDRISFSLEKGTIFGLLGPNGAGKTTTIRMIMNIILPDSGHVTVMDNSDMRTAADHIGYLPEERGMYRKMKVEELLLFLAELKSVPRKLAREKMGPWLERMGLAEWRTKKVEDLSKGMQQKLQIIGTLLHDPALLILDEPFSGLDPINTNLLKDILLELRDRGSTLILSTHVMESAEKICEEILLINKGKNVLRGKLSHIKKSYGNQNIVLEYSGNDAFLKKSELIQAIDNYGNHAEIKLKSGADPQALLQEAVQQVQVSRFEIREPSLNDIFIESVNRSNSEVNHDQ